MNAPITLGWIWAILPGSREWALFALVAVVLFGRSPALRKRVVRWGRPWRNGVANGNGGEARGYDGRTLILVAVVSAAFAAWFATWMTLGQRLPP